jgi:tetratricopeptide (TPR) repeat protein
VIYRDVLENARMPLLARQFFCAALIAEAAERRDQAASHFTAAAWACDDAGAVEQARICRQRAAEMLASAIEWGEVPAGSPVARGVLADLWRRAGRYDEALAACEAAAATLDPEDEGGPATVIGFIRELAEAGDEEAHSVAEAFAAEE